MATTKPRKLDSYACFRGRSNDHALRGHEYGISATRFGTHRRFRSLPHRGPWPNALTEECANVDVLPLRLVGAVPTAWSEGMEKHKGIFQYVNETLTRGTMYGHRHGQRSNAV